MQCDQNPVTLAAYLDGELQSGEAVALREHIAGCPACAAEVADLTALRRGLRSARARYVPSNEFRRKIQLQNASHKRLRGPQRYIPALFAIAAMLLIAIVWIRHSYQSEAFAEVADLHINALSSANPVDVVSTDRHTVKPWFQGKIPFSFNIPELSNSEFHLLGGRVIYFQQQPGAQLIVGMKQHKLSVLIFQESSQLRNMLPVVSSVDRRNSFNIETWESQGLQYFIIGDTEAAEIDSLTRLFKQVN